LIKTIKGIINYLFESPTKKKFRLAKEAREKRKLIEDDRKREALSHEAHRRSVASPNAAPC
jgi:hypothetical protein